MAIKKFKKETGGVSYESGETLLSFINQPVTISSAGNQVAVVVDGHPYGFDTVKDQVYFNDVLFAGDGDAAHVILRDQVFNP